MLEDWKTEIRKELKVFFLVGVWGEATGEAKQKLEPIQEQLHMLSFIPQTFTEHMLWAR